MWMGTGLTLGWRWEHGRGVTAGWLGLAVGWVDKDLGWLGAERPRDRG